MASPYFLMLKNKYKVGAQKFVLAPKLYNLFFSRARRNTREKTKERDSANKNDLLFKIDLILLAMVITSILSMWLAKAN
jgi:hypothetical protein